MERKESEPNPEPQAKPWLCACLEQRDPEIRNEDGVPAGPHSDSPWITASQLELNILAEGEPKKREQCGKRMKEKEEKKMNTGYHLLRCCSAVPSRRILGLHGRPFQQP